MRSIFGKYEFVRYLLLMSNTKFILRDHNLAVNLPAGLNSACFGYTPWYQNNLENREFHTIRYLSEFRYTKLLMHFKQSKLITMQSQCSNSPGKQLHIKNPKQCPQLAPYQRCPKRVTLRAHFWTHNSNTDYYFASPKIGNPRQNKFGHHFPVALITKALMAILSPLNHFHALTWLNFCESQWSGPKQSANKVKIV